MEQRDALIARLKKWKAALEPYEFSGDYGDYNNDGVQDVMFEIDEMIKRLSDSADEGRK